MHKTTMIAAFAAVLAASPMAFAAESASTATVPRPHAATSAERIQPGQIKATDLKGASVYDRQNEKVGSIKDIILDRGGKVAAVVLDVDDKNVAVGMNDLNIAMNSDNSAPQKVTVDMSKDQLKSARAFELTTTAASGNSSPPSAAEINAPARRR
jgi:sporulation protein YlmC with PRC-barrel domain